MSDHEDTDGVRQGYVLGLSASEGMDYLVSGPMFDRWLESVKDEAFDDGFYAGSELGYTPERKGDTMSGAQDSVVDSNAGQGDIERCLEAAVMWMRQRRNISQTHSNTEWELHEAANNIMSTTYYGDERGE